MMKRLLLYSFLSISLTGNAQDIFERLAMKQSDEGEVVISQSDKIRALVGVPKPQNGSSANYLDVKGYKIQIFSGNQQTESRKEAFEKEKIIKANFPDQKTYVSFNSPFWKLRVGDYPTYEEADAMLRKIRGRFKKFAREMYIIPEKVRIYLD